MKLAGAVIGVVVFAFVGEGFVIWQRQERQRAQDLRQIEDIFGGLILTTKDVKQCPWGHAALKDVPLAFGLLTANAAFDRAVENFEFYPGGCIIDPDFPQSILTCTACGSRVSGGSKQHPDWRLRSLDAKTFKPPFPVVLVELAESLREFSVSPTEFERSLLGGERGEPTVRVRTSTPRDVLAQRIHDALLELGAKPEGGVSTVRLQPESRAVTLTAFVKNIAVTAQVAGRQGDSEVMVTISTGGH